MPSPFRVPPVTKLPGPRSTGSGSPVSIDSSTGDHPERMVPSRGIASPGRTRMRAPTGSLSGGTSTPSSSSTLRTTRAVGGRSESRECIASAARVRARISMARPVARMDTISGAITPCNRAAKAPPPPRCTCRPPRAMASTALTPNAANVPRAMSVSMLVAPCRSNRALSRRNGQPPTISTAMARTRTVHPAVADSGPANATRRANTERGHETRTRRSQWSGSRFDAPACPWTTGIAV